MRISVGSVNHNYDISMMKNYTDSFADIDGQDFVDGHQYHITFEVRKILIQMILQNVYCNMFMHM